MLLFLWALAVAEDENAVLTREQYEQQYETQEQVAEQIDFLVAMAAEEARLEQAFLAFLADLTRLKNGEAPAGWEQPPIEWYETSGAPESFIPGVEVEGEVLTCYASDRRALEELGLLEGMPPISAYVGLYPSGCSFLEVMLQEVGKE
ncbi:hypothetical protein CMI37_18915 [Candidatus Pacearchaeota archaeon]|nr:hypothetical protein [Candidatus Pacearchaeota archaeon]|tara:strand:+ start:628 stop:1071 length:444 start_codon:yes stop_codon:yes gene_type:complete